MANIKDKALIPANSQWIIDRIELWNFGWEFAFDHPIPAPDRRLQVRDDKNNAPEREVVRLVQELKLPEGRVPAGVVTLDDYSVDGNTRFEALRRLQRPKFPCFILNEVWGTASEKAKWRMIGLGIDLNVHHGNRMADPDIVKRLPDVSQYADIGSARRIAELLGRKESFVQNALWEHRARQRAQKAGIVLNGKLTQTAVRKFGSSNLSDPQFAGALKLAMDAVLDASEVADLFKKLKESGSDEAALAVLKNETAHMEDRIRENRLTGGSRPPLAAKARQHMGWFFGYEDHPEELREHHPEKVEEYLAQWQRLVRIGEQVIVAQRGY